MRYRRIKHWLSVIDMNKSLLMMVANELGKYVFIAHVVAH